jgi:competence protein ComEA
MTTGQIALLVAGLVLGVLLAAVILGLRNRLAPAPIIISTAVPATTAAATATLPTTTAVPLIVYVNGAVSVPGVYSLPPGSRIQQAIDAAGGFAPGANTAIVNLAQPVQDGVQIYVPLTTEEAAPAPVITNPQPLEAAPGRSGSLPAGLININMATAEELEQLPGIGPALAQRIIDHRTEAGPFADIEAIMDVAGIGEAKFGQIRDLITTGP